ncbi:Hypothetical predicted protein, partial [Paramuricea clavata]
YLLYQEGKKQMHLKIAREPRALELFEDILMSNSCLYVHSESCHILSTNPGLDKILKSVVYSCHVLVIGVPKKSIYSILIGYKPCGLNINRTEKEETKRSPTEEYKYLYILRIIRL